MTSYRIGDLISFSYPALKLQGTEAHDKFPSVLVLHPLWQGTLMGLNFNYLTDQEINMFRMMLDPGFQLKYMDNLYKKSPQLVQEFDTIIGAAGSANITSPYDFYHKVVRPFIMVRGWDPFRRYTPSKMTNVRVVQKKEIITGEQAAGLFGVHPVRDHGKDEKEILKDLAQREATEDSGAYPGKDLLTPQERRFIDRLRGNALRVFDDYKRKFEYAKGPRLPTFRR
jgi:hypothetical protein